MNSGDRGGLYGYVPLPASVTYDDLGPLLSQVQQAVDDTVATCSTLSGSDISQIILHWHESMSMPGGLFRVKDAQDGSLSSPDLEVKIGPEQEQCPVCACEYLIKV